MEPIILLSLPLLPLLTAGVLVFLPEDRFDLFRKITLGVNLFCLLEVIFLFLRFPIGSPGYSFVFRQDWLPELWISYQVGVDGIGMTLLLLHALVSTSGSFISLWIRERVKEYMIFYLILVASIYGVFSSLDLFFLYLFYEMSVIPMYPLIGIWGSQNKEYASMKLVVYITTGAMLALAGVYASTGRLGLGLSI
jgi:NADH-quinone oxidoreductase subunit M